MPLVIKIFRFIFFYILYFILCMVVLAFSYEYWPAGTDMLFAFGAPFLLVRWQEKRRSRTKSATVQSMSERTLDTQNELASCPPQTDASTRLQSEKKNPLLPANHVTTDEDADHSDFLARTYRFIAVDVETANRQKSSICQIGLALVGTNRNIETIGFLINPGQSFDRFNVDLHGIDESSVQDAPSFETVLQMLRPFLERHVLVQHSHFDKNAFNEASEFYGVPRLRANWFDSVQIARKAWPELRGNGGHGLANLKAYLNLSFEHHDAEEDARAAAEIVLLAETVSGEDFVEMATPKRQKYQTSVALAGNQNGAFYGHVACFTGRLRMSRVEAATFAAGAGITVKTGVSKAVTLLIVGDQEKSLLAGHGKSRKHRRAEELQREGHQIAILGESEFLKLVGAD